MRRIVIFAIGLGIGTLVTAGIFIGNMPTDQSTTPTTQSPAVHQPDLTSMSAHVYVDEKRMLRVTFAPEAGPNRITLVPQMDGTVFIAALKDAVVVMDEGVCADKNGVLTRNDEYRWAVLLAGQALRFGKDC